LQVGKRYIFQYQLLTHFCLFQNIKSIEANIPNKIKNYEKIIETYYPEYLEELEGLSHATNINIDKLLTVQLILFADQHPECTVTLSTQNATKNNQTFLTQNWDAKYTNPIVFITRLFFTRHVKIHRVNFSTDHYSYVFLGIPILYEILLMNEKGLCFGANAINLATNRTIDTGLGISSYLLERKTLATCSNVNDVAYLWTHTIRASYDTEFWAFYLGCDATAWCDRNGSILMIEQSHSYITTVFGNSTNVTGGPANILWHANHDQWLNPNKTGSKFPGEDPSSARRAQRARELLLNNYGNITLDTCINLITDHGGGTNPNGPDSSDICRHPDSDDSDTTIFAWIAEPKEYTVYLTRGQPCNSNLIKYIFNKQLDEDPPIPNVNTDGQS
jgi:Acyl-coenzyme A:6-aminopenicillanic acid acyl-transferase